MTLQASGTFRVWAPPTRRSGTKNGKDWAFTEVQIFNVDDPKRQMAACIIDENVPITLEPDKDYLMVVEAETDFRSRPGVKIVKAQAAGK